MDPLWLGVSSSELLRINKVFGKIMSWLSIGQEQPTSDGPTVAGCLQLRAPEHTKKICEKAISWITSGKEQPASDEPTVPVHMFAASLPLSVFWCVISGCTIPKRARLPTVVWLSPWLLNIHTLVCVCSGALIWRHPATVGPA
jgi:hypothetical protein